MTLPEIKHFIDKSPMNISEHEYGHLKYSPYFNQLQNRIITFEALGDNEKSTIKRLNDSFTKYD